MKEPKYKCKTPSQILNAEKGGIIMPESQNSPQIQNAPPAIWDNSIPVRNQPKVYKIWFAPWEDTDGNLHWPSMVFTEVSKGKWNYGTKEIKQTNRYVPLQVDKRKDKKTKKEKKTLFNAVP